MTEWQPIETAPKDGTSILLLARGESWIAEVGGDPSSSPPKCAIGYWDPEGSSWCDSLGRFPGDPSFDHEDGVNLYTTGSWMSGGGWFQPNEVTHWMPLPEPPHE